MHYKKIKYVIFVFCIVLAKFAFCQDDISFEKSPIRALRGGGAISSLVAADFDQDGYVDLAAAELLNYKVSIYQNNSSLNSILFSASSSFQVGKEPKSLLSADFDGDNYPDILVMYQWEENISILRNISTLNNINFSIEVGPPHCDANYSFYLSNINGDDRMDLIICNSLDKILYLYINESQPGEIKWAEVVKRGINVGLSYSDQVLGIADFNNDGLDDIAVDAVNAGLFIYLNRTHGDTINFEFSYEQHFFFGNDDFIIPGDYDLDGDVDIAVLSSNLDDISFVKNNSIDTTINFTHEWSRRYSTKAHSPDFLMSCDLNGDSKDELICINSFILDLSNSGWNDNFISVLKNTSGSEYLSLAEAQIISVGHDPITGTCADFDNDGKIDIAIGGDDSGLISILHNQSTADDIHLNSAHIFSMPTIADAVDGADFNLDGKVDLVTIDFDSSVTILQNLSFGDKFDFLVTGTFNLPGYLRTPCIADFNNDGKDDILIANNKSTADGSGYIHIYQNTSQLANIVFAKDSMLIAGRGWNMVAIDMDEDNKIDVVMKKYNYHNQSLRDSIIILTNTSIGEDISFNSTKGLIGLGGLFTVNDFDGDGKNDIVSASIYGSFLHLYHNESNENEYKFISQQDISAFYNIRDLKHADFDDDGKYDLVICHEGREENIALYKNISTAGNMNFVLVSEYNVISKPSTVTIKDINYDGCPDIAIQNEFQHLILLKNQSSYDNISFEPWDNGSIIAGNRKPFIADMDNDGYVDIVSPLMYRKELWIQRTVVESSPVPVELGAFIAQQTGYGVKLSWTTYSGTNNYSFDLEKSTDNKFYIKFASIKGRGTTTEAQSYYYIDNEIINKKIYYRLKQIDTNGSFRYSNIISVTRKLPIAFALSQNYPNPFNPQTTIKYQIPKSSHVNLVIYNILGHAVRTLTDKEQQPGYYSIIWDGKDSSGNTVSSGTYFLRMNTTEFTQTRKLLLIR